MEPGSLITSGYDIDKKNWFLVEDAKACYSQQKWEQAISLFRESRSICASQQWLDGVRYADEMIEKASQELKKMLVREIDLEKPIEKKIRVICPTCHKTGVVQVDTHIMSEAMETQGDKLIRARVFSGEICEHDFTIYVDPNYRAR